ncbi:hypothetical protein IWW36_003583 [Coemansia brasiliensis]|uniref:Laccase n=1 Tax=Coemansia brasiliensis TaxID=2650707 RepID=A0A9W8LYF0_9FUNG|nr:hypothetical protein IWW36_003583 [Coemansia brasiliensis]
MKLALSLVLFAAAVAAQGEYTPAAPAVPAMTPMENESESIEMTEVESPNETEEAMATPVTASRPMIPAGAPDITSMLMQLANKFDFTNVATSVTSAPAIMAIVFDPTSNKFTFLSSTVSQSGGSYYVPVCPVDSITAAGSSSIAAQSDVCNYGIQLTSMPSNAASSLLQMLRTKIKLLLSLAKPSYFPGMGLFRGMQQEHPGYQMMQNQHGMPMIRDGRAPWKVIGVNGNVIVPPIYVTQGDVLLLNVQNSLNEPISLHFQGLLQNGTSYLDGTHMVTQCGIPPGDSYTYTIDTKAQAGTFFIKGTSNYQYADGLRTALVVREKYKSALSYDDEILFMLEDWNEEEFYPRMKRFDTLKTSQLTQNYPDALINGINGNKTQSVQFLPGKKYRVRLVNFAITYFFKFRIPGHKMHVIEADGVDTEPLEVDGIDIGPGQRYSAVISAHDTNAFNYIYNVTMYAAFISPVDGLNPRYYEGLVEYRKHAPIKAVASVSDEQLQWNSDMTLQPLVKKPLLTKTDKSIVLKERMLPTGYGVPYFALGEASYAPALVPTLFSALSMGELASNREIYGAQVEPHVLRHMEVVEVTIHCPGNRDHVFHIHGHDVQIVEFGPSGDASTANKTMPQVRKAGKWPMRRDTVLVRAFEYVKFRFCADNPGVWLLSEEVVTHFLKGLGITFIEAPDVLQQEQKLPEALKQMCLKQGIKASGNGAGNQDIDLAGLPSAVFMKDD